VEDVGLSRLHLLILFAAASGSLGAQGLIDSSKIAAANEAFDSGVSEARLKCYIEPLSPFLDFAFRFELGYLFRCPLKHFDGKPARIASVLRVTPEGGKPALFAQSYGIPGVPPALAKTTDVRKVNAEISASGAIALGEGKYTVELLLIDDRERVTRKKWKATASRKSDEKTVQVTTQPYTATSIHSRPWPDQNTHSSNGTRLTILLDAAPVNPRSLKLRAWDRAFLLDSVSSVLRELRADTTRVVAFNLDQQEEIFRQDNFDRSGLVKLSHALQKLELGSISYQKLSQPAGWSEILTRMASEEVEAKEPPDAVIFLGPTTRVSDKLPKEAFTKPRDNKTRFYYFEYFPAWHRGNEMPDAIHYFTSQCDGTVLKIHSPGEFASAIQKLRADMRLSESPAQAKVSGLEKPNY
jgi:hypothetical protein